MIDAQELKVEVVKDLGSLKEVWNELFSHAALKSPFLSWEWNYGWWEAVGRKISSTSLFILCARSNGEVVSLLPLYLHSPLFGLKRLLILGLSSIGTKSTYPEYVAILGHDSEEVRNLFVKEIRRHKWDELWFGLTSTTPFSELPSRSFETHTFRAGLAAGFDGYLSLLSSSVRSRARKLLRDKESISSLDLQIYQGDPSSKLEQLFSLHQKSWQERGEPGAFADATIREFHRNICQDHSALLPIIFELCSNGEPVAMVYGFLIGDTFFFYQSGVSGAGPVKSAGILLHLLAMKYLSETATVKAYDFLAGRSRYKEELSTESEQLIDLKLFNPSRISHAKRLFFRALERTKRNLKKTP